VSKRTEETVATLISRRWLSLTSPWRIGLCCPRKCVVIRSLKLSRWVRRICQEK